MSDDNPHSKTGHPGAEPVPPGLPLARGWKRVVFLILAGLFFLLGLLGAILPALPTTPFLLLTSYFLVRSSPRLNTALLNSKLIGPILRDWQIRRGVRRDVKVSAIIVVLGVVGLTLWLFDYPIWIASGIAVLAAVGILVIIRLPTL